MCTYNYLTNILVTYRRLKYNIGENVSTGTAGPTTEKWVKLISEPGHLPLLCHLAGIVAKIVVD